ncbi:MAG: hypothetical protein GWN14_19600, partial [candidate division Zixibacteria bacterium]|nr:hypothetical protein [candidate division Zixibacteria bacterium]NIX58060.1 hypothetical protein [candidate division Zixibacteria bacterium]
MALTAQEQAYLTASIDQQTAEEQAAAEQQARETALERRSQTTLRWLVAVFLIAAVISGIFAVQANQAEVEAVSQANIASTAAAEAETQRIIAEEKQIESDAQRAIAEEQSTLAISRELSAYALAQLSENPELSLLLSVQALETAYTKQAEQLLHSSLQESRLMKRISQVDGREGNIIAFTHVKNVNRFLVETSTDNLTQFDWIDPLTGEVEALPLEIPFDPDINIHRGYGSHVDMTGKKVTYIYGLREEKRMIFETWDIQSGDLEETIERPYDGGLWSFVGQSPDRRYVYISNMSLGTTILWDLQEDLSVEFSTAGGITWSSISPNGKILISVTPTENIFWDVEESLAAGEGVELGRYQHNRNINAFTV